jgi:hypothetical protein
MTINKPGKIVTSVLPGGIKKIQELNQTRLESFLSTGSVLKSDLVSNFSKSKSIGHYHCHCCVNGRKPAL